MQSSSLKFTIFSTLLAMSGLIMAQPASKSDEQTIREHIDQFFYALEMRDTALYRSLVMTDGQIWVSRETGKGTMVSMRTMGDDIQQLGRMTDKIEERAFLYDINIHGKAATVWAPYTLDLNGNFLHCGIDIFTLLRTKSGWKIISVAYTTEPDGCDVIKARYGIE